MERQRREPRPRKGRKQTLEGCFLRTWEDWSVGQEESSRENTTGPLRTTDKLHIKNKFSELLWNHKNTLSQVKIHIFHKALQLSLRCPFLCTYVWSAYYLPRLKKPLHSRSSALIKRNRWLRRQLQFSVWLINGKTTFVQHYSKRKSTINDLCPNHTIN